MIVAILVSLIVAIALLVTGYLEFRGSVEAALIPIRATETAEAQVFPSGGILAEDPTQTPYPTTIPLPAASDTPLSEKTPVHTLEQTKAPVTVNLPFMVTESGVVTHWGQVATGETHPPQAGDFNNNAIARGFLSFDLSSIPSNVVIHSAVLNIPKTAVEKDYGDLFPNFGSLIFEAVWYGLSLNPEAFDIPSYGVLQNAYGSPGPTIGVTSSIDQALQEGYSRFQIRFGFNLGTDDDDFGEVYWIPVTNGQGGVPTLEITYIP